MIELRREGDVTVVSLVEKRLDATLAPRFRSDVVGLVNDGASKLVLDLSQVQFMDSSGLGALVSVLKAVGGRGSVVVCGLSSSVQQLFRLTRMDKVFSIAPDVAGALAVAQG